jgi:hypothetical protein
LGSGRVAAVGPPNLLSLAAMARDVNWWMRESDVRIGTIWVPGRQVETILARYTKQLFCLTHVDTYPYAFLGTASGVRTGAKCYLLWCRHQTQQYQPDDVTIPVDDGKTLISESRFLYVQPDKSNDGEDFTDLSPWNFCPRITASRISMHIFSR